MKRTFLKTIILVLLIAQSACAEEKLPESEPVAQVEVPSVETSQNEIEEPSQPPTPENTPIPPTDIPTDTPEPTPTLAPLHLDDFSNPDSGWEHYKEGDGVLDYFEDGYRMRIPVIGNQYWVNFGQEFTDIRIEVDAVKLGGPENNQFGIMCRLDMNTFNYYGFIITSEGNYGIMKRFGVQDFQFMGTDGPQFSDIILTGDESNHIRADCIGNTLTLYVNGENLLEVQDDEIPFGDVGLVVGTIDEPNTDILFDNFILIEP